MKDYQRHYVTDQDKLKLILVNVHPWTNVKILHFQISIENC